MVWIELFSHITYNDQHTNSDKGVLMAKTYLLTALIMSMAISGCQVIHANQGKG